METEQKENIKNGIREHLKIMYRDYVSAKKDLHRHGLDVCKVLLETIFSQISVDEWEKMEITRLRGKTLENHIGKLNELIIGSFDGFTRLDIGNIIDVVNNDKKIIIELKNKHNSTKGSAKVKIYDDLAAALKTYEGYKAYYVEIIPNSTNPYNECFTPSDNTKKNNRPAREDIRKIDGNTFYHEIMGVDNGIFGIHRCLHEIIPEILSEECGSYGSKRFTEYKVFEDMLKKRYKSKKAS